MQTVAVGWIQRERDSTPVREYQSESLQDRVLKAHLINAYKRFKLSYFTFSSLLEKKEITEVKNILCSFFEEYLTNNSVFLGNILTLWCGVSFLPLDKQSFLRIHCVLSLLQASFPSIVHTAFMYRNDFAWCGFSLEDFKPLSQYLLFRLSRSQQQDYYSSSCSSASQSSSLSSSSNSYSNSKQNVSRYSRFIGEGSTPSDIVYIQDRTSKVKPHHLVIYVLAGVSLCMSFPASEKFNTSMFDKLGRLLESRISQLASDIGEQLSKKEEPETFRYIYHNHMNLATKSSIYGVNELPQETMQTIVDMHSDLVSNNSLELVVKTSLDFWVVGRSGNGRESYIVVSHKNANLVEISEEVNKMCESKFGSVFMAD
ncbi:Vacuolar fusion protein CCZ1-like protein [Armadillidium nasatum]|uniref:Vacuolar fusion protein CCZ1-like protein n=1 Tax=Armadillidium nasatum TaxID=96803 RepID=A0A5N5TEV3_9CRUS|nr:Vacuolar fusion protein CCZ1-like protein [Armadillidium nasatum]